VTAVEPRVLWKAAAFVEKLAALEAEFGARVAVHTGKVEFELAEGGSVFSIERGADRAAGSLLLGIDW
jgi:hypothetical protein